MADQSRLKEILLPVFLVLLIFFAAMAFPLLGVVMGLISPAPLIYVYVQKGRPVGMAAIGVVLVMILSLMGVKPALIFFAEYAVLSVIMAETIRLRMPMAKSVLLSAASSAAFSALLLTLFFADKGLSDLFQQQVRGSLEQSIETLKEMGKSQAELDSMRGLVDKATKVFSKVYPAFLVVGSLICAVVNFTLVRFLLTFLGRAAPDFLGKFSGWVLPEQFVWLFIFSAASFYLPQDELRAAGLNMFVVMMALYFLQGLAIVIHLLETKAAPGLLWAIVLFLVLTQPLVMGIVAGLGLFDLWADFRKFKPPSKDKEIDEE